MTSHSVLPRLLPGLYFLSLVVLSYVLDFNGLYGQDAHEYLRQSRAIFDRWHGFAIAPPGMGDAEFAGGYPLVGAMLRWVLGDSILALQMVSWLAAAFGLWFFVRLLTLLAPGARVESRWAFAGLGLVLCPMFLRAGLTCMSDALGFAFALASFFYGIRVFERKPLSNAIWAAAFAAMAISTRYSLAALLLPLAISIGYFLVERKKWFALTGAVCAGILAFLPHFWLKSGGVENPLGHSLLQEWSLLNFFKASFSTLSGSVSYSLPNGLYLLFPLAHPGFCLVLPGLFLLFKKTDLALPEKKILLACIVLYLVLLGGLPHQNLRYLLPVYALLLLLLFPAWDRLYCYGFLFFKRLTAGLLLGALVLQLFCCVRMLAPTLSRNHLEREIATTLKSTIPPDATIYAFDLDVALRTYLPEVQFHNLWERRYAEFPAGSYVLFNEALRPQWQGQNPILNWDFLKENYQLELRVELPNGWALWEIR